MAIVISSSLLAQDGGDELKKRFEKMKAELNLTEAQEVAIKEIIKEKREAKAAERAEEKSEELKTKEQVRAERMKQMQARKEQADDFRMKMQEILSPEQMEKFDQMMAERKQEMKMHRHKHNGEHRHQKLKNDELN